jgi:small ligand-binding sensory domain FIST
VQDFLSAHASGGDAASLLARCLEQLGGAVPPQATLGFIYATDAAVEAVPAILAGLQERMPGVHWLGCVGEGICTTGLEIYDEPAISLLLTDIPRESFCLLPASGTMSVPLPPEVMQWCALHPDCNGLLHGVPTHMATSSYLKAIHHYAPGAWLNGGFSSATGGYYHIADALLGHGLSGVLFAPQQPILSAHSQSCTPISDNLHIDEAQQNMVLRLNGRPALEVLQEVVGEVLWRDKSRLGSYIFIGLPADPCHGDDYLVRNLLGLDLEGGAIAAGDLMEHHRQLRFCRRDGNAARDELRAMLQRLKQQLGGRPIRGGLYISCIGRGRRQFGTDSEELKLITDELGDFPLAGFFANGEFYHGRLYSHTGVLTLFL